MIIQQTFMIIHYNGYCDNNKHKIRLFSIKIALHAYILQHQYAEVSRFFHKNQHNLCRFAVTSIEIEISAHNYQRNRNLLT